MTHMNPYDIFETRGERETSSFDSPYPRSLNRFWSRFRIPGTRGQTSLNNSTANKYFLPWNSVNPSGEWTTWTRGDNKIHPLSYILSSVLNGKQKPPRAGNNLRVNLRYLYFPFSCLFSTPIERREINKIAKIKAEIIRLTQEKGS